MKYGKKILCCILVLGILFSFSACKKSDPFSLLDTGASDFAAGKDDKDYGLDKAAKDLEKLIDDYSGDFSYPEAKELDDDEKNEIIEDLDNNTDDVITDTASSEKELFNILYKAIKENKSSVYVKFAQGFRYDVITNIDRIYAYAERKDPANAICMVAMSAGNYQDGVLVSLYYNYSDKELAAMKAETPGLVKSAVNTIQNKYHPSTEYEIVYAVNDYLCDTVFYPDDSQYTYYAQTAYGALKNGCAVCEGYAAAAKLLANKLGVEADMEFGYCPDFSNPDGGHAWNLMKVEGEWYQLDVTWNDVDESERLVYFLQTDAFMRQSREWLVKDYPSTPSKAYQP